MSDLEHSAYVSVDNKAVVPECITRFGVGTRVEVHKNRDNSYAVQAVEGDALRVFGDERWKTVLV